MTCPEFEKALQASELLEELIRVISEQIDGHMSIHRSCAYWKARLPTDHPTLLAEALAEVLCGTRTPAKRYAPRHEC